MRIRAKMLANTAALILSGGAVSVSAAAAQTGIQDETPNASARAAAVEEVDAEGLGSSPATAESLSSGVTWTYVWVTGQSYWNLSLLRDPSGGGYHLPWTGGYLYVGWNYVFCQKQGPQINEWISGKNYYNTWFLLTDDDSHHQGVWVSAIHFRGGGNNEPIPGVPACQF